MNLLPQALALSLLVSQVAQAEDVQIRIDTTLSVGSTVRTEAADPEQYAFIPSTTVAGAAPGRLTGQTGGSDLNFRRGRPVSTVAQGMFDFSLKTHDMGLCMRAAAWHDFTLGHAGAPYGNYGNGYISGIALSDAGLQRAARFDGLMLRDAYAFGNFELSDQLRIELRLGRQLLGVDGSQGQLSANWGGARLIGSGIAAALNPQDLVAQQRPGALAEEARVPVGMLNMHLVSGKRWSLDAFLPWETREAVLPACGTFFDIISVAPPGCALGSAIPYTFAGTPVSTVASLTEKSLLASGLYLQRLPEQMSSGRGQFGVAAHLRVEQLRTEFSAYALNSPVTTPYFHVRIDNVRGAPVSVGLPGQAGLVFSALQRLNPWVSQLPSSLAAAYTAPPFGQGNGLEYGVTYPKSVRLFGIAFNTEATSSARIFGELAYRPNQPLSYNLNDLLNALLLRTPTALLAQQRNILAVPAGGDFAAYDRKAVFTSSLGVGQIFPNALGSSSLRLSAEVGLSHVNNLPDPQVLRYGRAFAYGSAPYRDATTNALSNCAQPANGAGLYFAPGKTCTSDGFVTPTAWGLRVATAAVYPNALLGAALTPSLGLGWDLHGYAFDGSFSAGRRLVRPGLRASWGQSFWADLSYTRIFGGRYNLLADRDNLALSLGAKF